MKSSVLRFVLLMILLGFLMNPDITIRAEETGHTQEETVTENEAEDSEDKNVSENTAGEEGDAEVSGNVDLGLSAPSYLLMEASTGAVILEHNPTEVLRPASVTKIMTLLLIFDALDAGKIKLEDEVVVSEYAASMGGSQVFLEAGERQTVETLIKCIAVASGNDASVAMAEHIAGSEAEFVNRMNERAKSLGMEQSFFHNSCGLDADGHVTTAADVAKMSRELITKYPQISDYSMIWMEDITHVTARGESAFGLSNTNKLVKQYEYATGLKTGSTSLAKFCVSATARKDGIDLIAVIMAAPDPKIRFHDAVTLLNYGFSVSQVYQDANLDTVSSQRVNGGVQEEVPIVYEGPFSYLSVKNEALQNVRKEIRMEETCQAPIKKGQQAGEAVYLIEDKRIGSVRLLYGADVEKAHYSDFLYRVYQKMIL